MTSTTPNPAEASPFATDLDTDDLLTFGDEPPSFHTSASRVGDDGKVCERLLVATMGDGFERVRATWPNATNEERGQMFWDVGLVHLWEIAIALLPPEPRARAVRRATELDRRDPHGLGPKLALIATEEGTIDAGAAAMTRPRFRGAEAEAYRRLRILRASGPFVPQGETVSLVVVQQGGIVPGFVCKKAEADYLTLGV